MSDTAVGKFDASKSGTMQGASDSNAGLEAKMEKLRALNEKYRVPTVRPVRCFFCGAQMYYKGHECHEPELRITITDSYDDDGETFYCHIRCWDERMLAGLASNK